ncbi:MAG: phage portal protein [Kiritimatiellia bacterium]
MKIYRATTALIGQVISLVSPVAAARYKAGREFYRSYTAGSLRDADRNFTPRLTSADSDIRKAWPLITARCRDQVENNPLISGAIERICQNVVRNGINPKFKFKTSAGVIDAAANAKWQESFRRWRRYCESTGHDTWKGVQRLVLRHLWSDGQCFAHRCFDFSIPGVNPLRLELLESDMLDPTVDGPQANGNLARKGIEYNSNGRPVTYHFLSHHPGDWVAWTTLKTRKIPAADIIHVWDRRRISQFSGIAWLAAVVMEAYRMEDFRHITMDEARIQTIFGAFLRSTFPAFQLGQGMPLGGQATPTAAKTGATDAPTEISSPMIQKLPSGTELQFTPTAHPGSQYEPFVKDSQRWQSAGLGMSFEGFANNYTDSSYASARSGALEERLGYRGQQNVLDEQFCRDVYAWYIAADMLAGTAPSPLPGYFKNPLLWHEAVETGFPGWSWVDPTNDATASEKLIGMGLSTHAKQSAQHGEDFDMNVETLIEEELKLTRLAEVRAARLKIESGQEANNV